MNEFEKKFNKKIYLLFSSFEILSFFLKKNKRFKLLLIYL